MHVFPAQREASDAVKQAAERRALRQIGRHAPEHPSPERKRDAVAERLVPCAVGCLALFAGAVGIVADVRPAIRKSLKPFTFQRGQTPHDHAMHKRFFRTAARVRSQCAILFYIGIAFSVNSDNQIRAVLVVPLFARAGNVSPAVITKVLHLIRQRHLIPACSHSRLQARHGLSAFADHIAGVRHIQRHRHHPMPVAGGQRG